MGTPKYKVCKHCGNRNHPRSGQCPWCGASLYSPRDWISFLGILVIALVLVGLVFYAVSDQPPSPTQLRVPNLLRLASLGN